MSSSPLLFNSLRHQWYMHSLIGLFHIGPFGVHYSILAMANLRQLQNDYIRFSSLCSKKKRSFVFFSFSSSSQSLTKTFVLLRFSKILKGFTSFLFVFANVWDTPIRFTFDFESVGLISFASVRSCQILEQPWSFLFHPGEIED